MVKATENIIRAAVNADSTITPEQLRAALAALAGKNPSPATAPLPRILSREEVANLIRKSVKAVDVLCRRGALRRVYANGTDKKRALGISEESYRALTATTEEGTK